MSHDFVLCRIAQDAFDPVALADEVNESGVSSIKHGMARSRFRILRRCHRPYPNNCGSCAILAAMKCASSFVRTFASMASASVVARP
jgi:hypothetical protein